MESDWDEFKRREVAVLAITTQKREGLSGAKKFLETHAYRFPILFDEKRDTTKAYGVFHRIGLDAYRIARPAAFLLDKESVIRWIGVAPNQTRWPTSEHLLRVVDATSVS